jgi:hypothetical protein
MNRSSWLSAAAVAALLTGISFTASAQPPPGAPGRAPAPGARRDMPGKPADKAAKPGDKKDGREEAREDRKEGREEAREDRKDGGDEAREEGKDGGPEARPEEKSARERLKRPKEDRRREHRDRIRQKWGDEVVRTPALRNELRVHAWRLARLTRVRALAEGENKTELIARVDSLLAKEEARHERRMAELGAKAVPPGQAKEPGEAANPDAGKSDDKPADKPAGKPAGKSAAAPGGGAK